MIKYMIAGLFFTCSTMILSAQDLEEETMQKWSAMKQVNPNLKETNTIRIFDDPQQVYQLELKDGKPYNGYEISDEMLLNELNVVNFYQNGALVAKYAIDYLQADGTSHPVQYTLKTTYQDGKVIDGPVFRELPENMVMIEQYKSGKQVGFLLDLFAMHYFNRLSFQLKGNMLSIHNLQSNNEIRIYKKNELLAADYYDGNELKASSRKIVTPTETIVPHATELYYIDNEMALQTFTCIFEEPVYVEEAEDDFLPLIFAQFSFEFKGELSEVLKTGHDFFVSKEKINKRDLNSMFGSLIVPYDEESYLTTLNYDANGKPMSGTAIRTVGKDQYEVIVYENGKVKSTKTINDLFQLKYEDFEDENSLDGSN